MRQEVDDLYKRGFRVRLIAEEGNDVSVLLRILSHPGLLDGIVLQVNLEATRNGRGRLEAVVDSNDHLRKFSELVQRFEVGAD